MFRITYLESLSESEVWEEDVFLQRVSHLPAVLLGDRLLVDGDGSAVVLYSTHQGVQQSRLTGSYVVETSVWSWWIISTFSAEVVQKKISESDKLFGLLQVKKVLTRASFHGNNVLKESNLKESNKCTTSPKTLMSWYWCSNLWTPWWRAFLLASPCRWCCAESFSLRTRRSPPGTPGPDPWPSGSDPFRHSKPTRNSVRQFTTIMCADTNRLRRMTFEESFFLLQRRERTHDKSKSVPQPSRCVHCGRGHSPSKLIYCHLVLLWLSFLPSFWLGQNWKQKSKQSRIQICCHQACELLFSVANARHSGMLLQCHLCGVHVRVNCPLGVPKSSQLLSVLLRLLREASRYQFMSTWHFRTSPIGTVRNSLASCTLQFVHTWLQPKNVFLVISLSWIRENMYTCAVCVCVCECMCARVCVCVRACPSACVVWWRLNLLSFKFIRSIGFVHCKEDPSHLLSWHHLTLNCHPNIRLVFISSPNSKETDGIELMNGHCSFYQIKNQAQTKKSVWGCSIFGKLLSCSRNIRIQPHYSISIQNLL